MSAPAIAENEGEDDDDAGGDGGDVESIDTTDDPDVEAIDQKDDPDVETVDLSEDDLRDDADDLFTGVEDADSGSEDSDEGKESDSDEETPLGGSGGGSDALERRVNHGVARLAVVGLDDEYCMEDDEDDDALEAEFREIFEVFGVGHYASDFVSEYVLTGDKEDVDPAWGLLGSLLAAAALAVVMRPDGEERVEDAKGVVSGIGEKLGADL